MKYAGMPFGMWMLFAGSFQKQLTAAPTRGAWNFTNTRMVAATRDALPSAASVFRLPEYASTTFLTSDIGTASVQTNLYTFRFPSCNFMIAVSIIWALGKCVKKCSVYSSNMKAVFHSGAL